MAQYQAMRRSLPDDILLFYRLGDFYEMFFEDAKTAAEILNVESLGASRVPHIRLVNLNFTARHEKWNRKSKSGAKKIWPFTEWDQDITCCIYSSSS